MTCIAWDGKTLAADKRATNSSCARTTTKIFRVTDCLVAFSGDAVQGLEMLAWFRDGAKVASFPASQRTDAWATFIVICRDGIALYEQTPYPMRIEDAQFAAGSGRDYALAAMHCGKTAAEAVAVACAFDPGCGNGIDTMDLIEISPGAG